jgi:hypothetical protein
MDGQLRVIARLFLAGMHGSFVASAPQDDIGLGRCIGSSPWALLFSLGEEFLHLREIPIRQMTSSCTFEEFLSVK